MKMLLTILLITAPCVAGQELKSFGAELPIIRTAAERNNCTGDLFYILLAIRKAENGGDRRQFGIIHPRCDKQMDLRPRDTLDIQAGWSAATVVKNHQRWIKAGKPKDFIGFLASRYCPVGCDTDNGTNKYWIKNVRYWYRKLKGQKCSR